MNSYKLFLLILLVGLGLGACQDFLNPSADDQSTAERIYKDPAFAEGIMINAYTSLPTAYSFNDVATDDAVTNDQGNVYLRMATGEWSSLFDPTTVWMRSYQVIVNLNYFLSVCEKVQWSWQDTIKNRLFRQRHLAEATALRGYYYLQLLSHYGGVASDGSLLGVPITNHLLTVNDDWKLPRATFQETVDQINSDLNAGINILPYMYFNRSGVAPYDLAWNKVYGAVQNKNRLDGRIARALKARLALLAASPAFNGGTTYNLVQADSAAKISGKLLVINGGIAGLSPDNIFWDSDEDIDNPDIMWRNDYYEDNTLEYYNYPPTKYGNGRINPTQNLVDAFPMQNGYPIQDSGSGYDPANPYENRDPRLKANILTNGDVLRSQNIWTAADGPDDNGLNHVPGYSTRTGYYMLKFLRTSISVNPVVWSSARHFFTHIRWTEMYLTYAEAANEAYGPDADPNGFGFTARDIIKAIRKRAGLEQPDDYLASLQGKDQLRSLIQNERRLEFCFEGMRFWDIRRWNLPLNETAKGTSITAGVNHTINVENRVYQPYMLYAPIPDDQTRKYPGLLQNKGW